MQITLERVNAANFDSLTALLGQLAEFEHLRGPDAEAKERLRRDALSATPMFEGYLALFEAEPVGFITLCTTYSTFPARPVLYLEDLFVVEPYRRSGVGRQMFDFCVSLAQERSCVRLEWNVLNWNSAAIGFYQKNNAYPVRAWTWYRLPL